jgi:hypothetical protein
MQFPDITSFNSIIKNQEVVQVKLRPDLVYFKLKITLIDDTILHVRENHLQVSNWHEYSYQWQDSNHRLIHLIAVPPHHQHVGSEENIQPSEPMTLEKVLEYIAEQLSPQRKILR